MRPWALGRWCLPSREAPGQTRSAATGVLLGATAGLGAAFRLCFGSSVLVGAGVSQAVPRREEGGAQRKGQHGRDGGGSWDSMEAHLSRYGLNTCCAPGPVPSMGVWRGWHPTALLWGLVVLGVDDAEGDKQAPGPAVICEHEGHRWRHVGVSVGSCLRVRVWSLQARHRQVQRPRGRWGVGHAGKELGSGSPWCHAGVMLRAQSVAGQGGLWGPGWRQALWSGQETRLTKGQGAEGWLGPGSVGPADPACVRHQERGGDESCKREPQELRESSRVLGWAPQAGRSIWAARVLSPPGNVGCGLCRAACSQQTLRGQEGRWAGVGRSGAVGEMQWAS